MIKGFSKIWIIVIALAVVTGGFFAWQKFGIQRKEIKQVINDETASWQTYKNTQYGFEIKYPKDDDKKIQIDENSSGVVISTAEERNCVGGDCPTFMYLAPIYTELNVLSNSLEKLIKDGYVLKAFKEFQITKEESNGNIDYIKRINFGNNIQGYLLHEWAQASGACHYIAKEGNRSIDIERTEVGIASLNCNNDYMFNQMLSTFRFLR